MQSVIKYHKGKALSGAISIVEYAGNVSFIAVTAGASKTYKTFKGAEKFMLKNGYTQTG